MKYKALNNFFYDGNEIKKGDMIEFDDDKLAKPLIGNGNLAPTKEKAKAPASEPEEVSKPKTNEQLKKELDELGIEYPKKAVKPELEKLLEEAEK